VIHRADVAAVTGDLPSAVLHRRRGCRQRLVTSNIWKDAEVGLTRPADLSPTAVDQRHSPRHHWAPLCPFCRPGLHSLPSFPPVGLAHSPYSSDRSGRPSQKRSRSHERPLALSSPQVACTDALLGRHLRHVQSRLAASSTRTATDTKSPCAPSCLHSLYGCLWSRYVLPFLLIARCTVSVVRSCQDTPWSPIRVADRVNQRVTGWSVWALAYVSLQTRAVLLRPHRLL
jgi:hypothetical protein